MTQPLRAYIYTRVSNDDEDGNNALGTAQRASCRAWCAKNGVVVVEEFEELNVSGRKLHRRKFDRMMAQSTAADRPVHMIVMRSMVAVMNEKYANDASIFTARNRRGNASAGYWNGGPVRYGYESRVVIMEGRKGRKKLFIREDEAAVVKLIYELADAKGVKPTEAEAIVVACPQIVAPDAIARVAPIRAKAAPAVTPPRTTNSPVLLGGLATCGHPECRSGMVLRTGKVRIATLSATGRRRQVP